MDSSRRGAGRLALTGSAGRRGRGCERRGRAALRPGARRCRWMRRSRHRDLASGAGPICLDCDTADRHVFDVAVRQRSEELAGIEAAGVGQWRRLVRPMAARRPARSSAATAFQLSASSRRSGIGRRRAASTVAAGTSGSRTASAPKGSVIREDVFNDVMRSAYRGLRGHR